MQQIHDGSSLFDDREWCLIAESLSLSPRERQITQGVLHDLKEAAIARRLGISRHTVHTYIERIYHKLTVNSRVQLVVRVVAEYLDLMTEQAPAESAHGELPSAAAGPRPHEPARFR